MPDDAPDWLTTAIGNIAQTPLGPYAEHKGRVEDVSDGIAMVSGLGNVRLDEVLRFEGGQTGFARVLDPELIGCVLLDTATEVQAGDAV